MNVRAIIRLILAILEQAREDELRLKRTNRRRFVPMWRTFTKTDIYRRGLRGNVSSLETAVWVMDYIREK